LEKESPKNETNSKMEVEEQLSQNNDRPMWKITDFEKVPKCKQCKIRNISCLAA